MHTIYISLASYWGICLSSCLVPFFFFIKCFSESCTNAKMASPVEFSDITVQHYSWSCSGLPLFENMAGLVSKGSMKVYNIVQEYVGIHN